MLSGYPSPQRDRIIEIKQAMGVAGAILLFIGVFAPIVRVPAVGDQNYLQYGSAHGLLIMTLAVVSLLLAIANCCRWLWLPGIGSVILLALTFYQVQQQQQTPLGRVLGIVGMTTQLQWGWAPLIMGTVLVTATAVIQEASERNA